MICSSMIEKVNFVKIPKVELEYLQVCVWISQSSFEPRICFKPLSNKIGTQITCHSLVILKVKIQQSLISNTRLFTIFSCLKTTIFYSFSLTFIFSSWKLNTSKEKLLRKAILLGLQLRHRH